MRSPNDRDQEVRVVRAARVNDVHSRVTRVLVTRKGCIRQSTPWDIPPLHEDAQLFAGMKQCRGSPDLDFQRDALTGAQPLLAGMRVERLLGS